MADWKAPRKQVLVAQQDAILDYLDGLLRELPEEYPEPAPVPEPTAPVAEPLPPKEAPPKRAIAPSKPVAVEAPAPVEVVVDAPVPESTPKVQPDVQPQAEPVAARSGIPEWAEPDFQALLFQVGGLKLAVPLVKLHSVVPWSEKITPVPGLPAWCHGLFRYRERNVRVVDTATMVFPPDKRDADLETNHILVVGDGEWGLSCTAIGDVIKLNPAEVKWRRGRGQRPWLAGTVLGHLCALLDTEAFADMLTESTRKGNKRP
ncbi:hypothetical protein CAI21_11675 [Alkalilimnicola ehrlichii]|uniref:CheW-like domain-containing protein n=1 Tax=Alkalilimnicola ehrlichii TaxID=351052 RepID=A0A3E0WTH2_9GAMM|nr:chemotaxis protein CheW [Alkalilimnicola ehrlichii]RFA28527.1 hypothetical protein CAI21_11675 [Alkalilimnicola ehrlichii]RFA35689.1 hypothetical protein CAL65_12195 [Alkalilimnicola ehrlichii]